MNDVNREDDPDKLWEMINARDETIRKLREQTPQDHWYTYRTANGTYDQKYFCHCGYVAQSEKSLDSHIAWKERYRWEYECKSSNNL